MNVENRKVDGLRILSLDGGDLNCISQLKILEEFMNRLEHDSDADKAMRPCEYFHSITGVGASGVIAILLGVLGLSVTDTIEAFLRLCGEVSLGEELGPHLRSEKLVSATKVLLQGIGVSEEAKLNGDLTLGGGCKVSIPYMAAVDLSHCRTMRNYDSVHPSPNPTIPDAIRIAWANPGLFSPVPVGQKLMQEILISAVSSVNNPAPKAVEEAYNIFGKDQRVCCVLSLGTSKPLISPLRTGSLEVDQMIARDTEATAEQLRRRYTGLGIYFRLSMDRYIDFGAASEAIELRAGRISSYASSYLETSEASETLESCLRSSRQASHITLESLYRTRAFGSRSSRGLPPLSAFFVTREKPMNDIVQALKTRTPGSPAIALIIGLSGTGKTQISLKYAYDHDDEYDHIIFVDASSTESLEKTLVTRIKSIDRQLGATNAEEALDLLVNPEGKLTHNWLIIVDNADNSDVKLQDYIPSCDHGCILITSRNAALSDLHPEGHVEIGVMTHEEAVGALLSAAVAPKTSTRSEGPNKSGTGTGISSSHSHTKQEKECARRIVEELGCLPLAVIQAACYIKKQKCLHEYPNILKTSRNKILRWPASVQRDTLKYAHSTYAAFDTTLNILSPRALKFLGIISFVNFSDFPKALIGLAASLQFEYQPHDLLDRPPEYQLSIDLLREILCPDGGWDPMELDSLLEELQSYSLVSLVTASTIVTLRFHPLLHGWANDRLSTSDRPVFQSAAVRLLACGTNRDDASLWPYLSSHIERFSLVTDQLHVNDRGAFTAILRSNRQYSRIVEVWENIHAIVDRVHGERHLRTTRATLQLAVAYNNDQRDWQRMESMERKVVEIRRETLGDDHMETATAMANLARTYKRNGRRFDEAIELELEVLRVRMEHCGPKHRDIVLAITDLAETCRRQRKYKESQNLLVEASDMISSLLGRAHPAAIRALQQLSRCYALSNEKDEAMKLDREIIELQRMVHGEMHVETLTAMAQLYYRQGQADEAQKIWQDLAEEVRGAAGGHREHILQSLSSLARSTYQQSRYAESEVLWREVIAARHATLGAEHVDTVDAQDWLFHSLYKQELYEEAEVLGRDVVTRLRRDLGQRHIKTLSSVRCMAICIFKQERYAEAELLWRELVAARHATLGAEHADTMDAKDWLFHSIHEQGRYGEAEIIGQQLVKGLRRIYGENHIDTLSALDYLAICIFKQERYAEAGVLWREVVAAMHATLGAEHADTMDAKGWLFHSLYRQELYEEAEVLGQDVVAGLRRTFGGTHTDTLSNLLRLAICIHRQTRFVEAEVLFREVVAGRQHTLGEQHEDTLSARRWLEFAIEHSAKASGAELPTSSIPKGGLADDSPESILTEPSESPFIQKDAGEGSEGL